MIRRELELESMLLLSLLRRHEFQFESLKLSSESLLTLSLLRRLKFLFESLTLSSESLLTISLLRQWYFMLDSKVSVAAIWVLLSLCPWKRLAAANFLLSATRMVMKMMEIENFMIRSFEFVAGVNISSFYVQFIATRTLLILCCKNPTLLWFCLRV